MATPQTNITRLRAHPLYLYNCKEALNDHEKRWHSVNELDWIRSAVYCDAPCPPFVKLCPSFLCKLRGCKQGMDILHGQRFNQDLMFAVLYRPHRFRSHHNATWQRLQHSMMHWSLLVVVVSSMGNEENRHPLPRARSLTQLPTCDVFLAPSTIPGSACVHENINK